MRKFVQKIKKIRKDFCVISGFDDYLVPNLLSSGDGIIGGLTNPLIVGLKEAVELSLNLDINTSFILLPTETADSKIKLNIDKKKSVED